MLRPQLLALAVLAPAVAHGHFYLHEPASWRDQDALGNPQKLGPCGDDGDAAETGAVTTYAPGDTVRIRISEKIFHPGHYRVALAVDDRSELPEPPPVTVGSTPCGSAPIDDDPAFPVLADGLLVHTTPLDGEQTMEVTLPDDVACEACTLQVLEFMSNHALNDPGGCWYSHCATLRIQDGAVDTSDSSPSASDTGPSGPDTSDDTGASKAGCGCATGVPWGGAPLLWIGVLAIGRRRRA
ncbi:MAG: lytic polysaccharide monooxygenase [Myxococcales bacterium]|nr:lytic polysaccharide monooxygenase [Myxococcales bacterium]